MIRDLLAPLPPNVGKSSRLRLEDQLLEFSTDSFLLSNKVYLRRRVTTLGYWARLKVLDLNLREAFWP